MTLVIKASHAHVQSSSERAKNESHNLRQNMFNSPNTFKTFWLLDQAETPRVSYSTYNVRYIDRHVFNVFNRRHIIDERCRETLTMSFVNCNRVSSR